MPTLKEIRQRFSAINVARGKLLTVMAQREAILQVELDHERARFLTVLKTQQVELNSERAQLLATLERRRVQRFIHETEDTIKEASEHLVFGEYDFKVSPPRLEQKSEVSKEIFSSGPFFENGVVVDLYEGAQPKISLHVNAQGIPDDEIYFTMMVDGGHLGAAAMGALRTDGLQQSVSWEWMSPPLRGGEHEFNVHLSAPKEYCVVSVELQVLIM